MSFQAYLDNIKLNTGKGPDDFKALAEQRGFTRDSRLQDGSRPAPASSG